MLHATALPLPLLFLPHPEITVIWCAERKIRVVGTGFHLDTPAPKQRGSGMFSSVRNYFRRVSILLLLSVCRHHSRKLAIAE
jgi:hypothetical protein